MKTIARLILTPILFMMVASVAHGAGAPSAWAEAEVDDARGHGLIVSEADDNYQDYITRELFCKLVVQMVEERTGGPVGVSIANPFADTANEAIVKAYQMGIVKGISETEFAPDHLITRQEVAVMMMRASRQLDDMSGTGFADNVDVAGISFADQSSIAGWALEDVKEANKLGIMNGVGGNKINPLGNTTVEQSILLNLRLYNEFGSGGSGMGGGTTAAPATTTATPAAANTAPVLNALTYDISLNDGESVTVLGADLATDADGDDLTIDSASFNTGSANGTFTINGQGRLVYAALDRAGHTVGRSVLNVVVTDGTDTTETVLVTFNVNNPNHGPVVKDNVAFEVVENTGLNIHVSELAEVGSNGLDADGDTLSVISVSSPDGAVVNTINNGSQIAFTGNDLNSDEGVRYTVTAEITDGYENATLDFIIREVGSTYARPEVLSSTAPVYNYEAGDPEDFILLSELISYTDQMEITDIEKSNFTLSIYSSNAGVLTEQNGLLVGHSDFLKFEPVDSINTMYESANAAYEITMDDGCYEVVAEMVIKVNNPNYAPHMTLPGDVLITTAQTITVPMHTVTVPQNVTMQTFQLDPNLINP